MSLTLWLLGAISVLELLVWWPPLWPLRRPLIVVIVPVLSLSSGLLFGWDVSIWAGLMLVLSIYRIINSLRVLDARMQPSHLYKSTMRTGWWLIGAQLLVFGGSRLHISDMAWLYGAALSQLAGASLLWLSTSYNLRHSKSPANPRNLSDKELPTLSIAIPARNETRDLEECLRSLVASNYPKFEILVLDDCSQNKRTPGIIRDFAQSGVRFIAGKVPPEHWLAKNYAYAQLAEEANGELLLFCGVDTRFKPDSLRSMVETMLQDRKAMLSLIPHNDPPGSLDLESLFVQPARYAWELSLPRNLISRPPVLSTCWIITADELRRAGGFEAVSRSISPESYFARSSARHKDSYSFMQSGRTMDLGSAKSLAEQRATAVRTRYPQLHRRPELVALSGIGELAVLAWPFVMLVTSILSHDWLLAVTATIACLLLISFYARVVRLTYRRFLWRGLWTLPLVAIYDIGILNYSMWRYEFRQVVWKGRNVCIPVMRHAGSEKTP